MKKRREHITRLKANLQLSKSQILRDRVSRFPTLEEIESMNSLAFLKLRLENSEPWENDDEHFRDKDRVEAIEAYLSEKGRTNAQKPRPSRKHPRAAQAMKLAEAIWKTKPSLSKNAVATRTAARMEGDDIPSVRTIERYLSSE